MRVVQKPIGLDGKRRGGGDGGRIIADICILLCVGNVADSYAGDKHKHGSIRTRIIVKCYTYNHVIARTEKGKQPQMTKDCSTFVDSKQYQVVKKHTDHHQHCPYVRYMYQRFHQEISANSGQQSKNKKFQIMARLLLLRRNFCQTKSSCVDLVPTEPEEDMAGCNRNVT